MAEFGAGMKKGGRRMTALGVIAMVLGVLAMLAPLAAGMSIVFLLGALVATVGALRMFWAFRAGSLGRGLWVFVIGTLTLVCGIAMLANPLFGSGVLTILLALYFVLDGTAEIIAGLAGRQEGRGWLLFSGTVSLVLGIMIWLQFPLSGAWAMGILLGIKLLFVGIGMLVGGSAVRRLATIR